MIRTLPDARDRCSRTWGEMASRWGIHKTLARIHALPMALA